MTDNYNVQPGPVCLSGDRLPVITVDVLAGAVVAVVGAATYTTENLHDVDATSSTRTKSIKVNITATTQYRASLC